MEGLRVLVTGFDKAEQLQVHQLVKSMRMEACTKTSMNIDVVIAKDVLASKYKWAAFSLRKPIVHIDWLHHCNQEQRRVPYEHYRLPIFAGLLVSTTGISISLRNKIQDLLIKNGGEFSANLTQQCTHLIATCSKSDKYKVAKIHWCQIKLVNEKWFWQSIEEKVCLEEELFAVDEEDVNQDGKDGTFSVSHPMPMLSCAEDSPTIPSSMEQPIDNNHEAVNVGNENEYYLSGCRVYLAGFEPTAMRRLIDILLDGGGTRHLEFQQRITHVILGSPCESELKEIRESALWGAVHVLHPIWLEECSQKRKEVAVLTRHTVSLKSLLEGGIRNLSSLRTAKSGTVMEQQAGATKAGDSPSCVLENNHTLQSPMACCSQPAGGQPLNKPNLGTISSIVEEEVETRQHMLPSKTSNRGREQSPRTVHMTTPLEETQNKVFQGYSFGFSSKFPMERRAEIVEWVIEGGGAMQVEPNGSAIQKLDFIVGDHGSMPVTPTGGHAKHVSSHWIKCCLEEKEMVDIGSHIIFHPLPCQVPLPGFEKFRFCVSQFEQKDRLLLHNLCHTLGAKFQHKTMSKRVTHLLCMIRGGDKYHAALEWGIKVVTPEWIYTCIAQNSIVDVHQFRPKEMSAAEKGLDMKFLSQYPTDGAFLDSYEQSSGKVSTPENQQCPAQAHCFKTLHGKGRQGYKTVKARNRSRGNSVAQLSQGTGVNSRVLPSSKGGVDCLDPWDELTAPWTAFSQGPLERPLTRSQAKAMNLAQGTRVDWIDPNFGHGVETHEENEIGSNSRGKGILQEVAFTGNGIRESTQEPETDVAAAIEDLLAQTCKVMPDEVSKSHIADQDLVSPGPTQLERQNREVRHLHSNFKRPRLFPSRNHELIEECLNRVSDDDSLEQFQESQMDSQVVGYDEDFSGKQKIIERVRTRSITTAAFYSTKGTSEVGEKNGWERTDFNRLFEAAEANK